MSSNELHPYVPPPFGGDPNRSQFADAQDDDDDTGVAAVRQIKMEDDAGSERPESPVGWVKYDSFDMAEQRATQDGIIVDEAIVPLLSTCEDFEMYARRYPISSLAISRLAVAMKELKQEDSVLVAVKAQYANVREGKQTPARRAFKTFAKLIPPGPSSAPLPHVLPKRLKFLKPKVPTLNPPGASTSTATAPAEASGGGATTVLPAEEQSSDASTSTATAPAEASGGGATTVLPAEEQAFNPPGASTPTFTPADDDSDGASALDVDMHLGSGGFDVDFALGVTNDFEALPSPPSMREIRAEMERTAFDFGPLTVAASSTQAARTQPPPSAQPSPPQQPAQPTQPGVIMPSAPPQQPAPASSAQPQPTQSDAIMPSAPPQQPAPPSSAQPKPTQPGATEQPAPLEPAAPATSAQAQPTQPETPMLLVPPTPPESEPTQPKPRTSSYLQALQKRAARGEDHAEGASPPAVNDFDAQYRQRMVGLAERQLPPVPSAPPAPSPQERHKLNIATLMKGNDARSMGDTLAASSSGPANTTAPSAAAASESTDVPMTEDVPQATAHASPQTPPRRRRPPSSSPSLALTPSDSEGEQQRRPPPSSSPAPDDVRMTPRSMRVPVCDNAALARSKLADLWIDSEDDDGGTYREDAPPPTSPTDSAWAREWPEDSNDANVDSEDESNTEEVIDMNDPAVVERINMLRFVTGSVRRPLSWGRLRTDDDYPIEQQIDAEVANLHEESERWFRHHLSRLDDTAAAIIEATTPFRYLTRREMHDDIDSLFRPSIIGGTPVPDTVNDTIEVCYNLLARAAVKTNTPLEHITGMLHEAGPTRGPNMWNMFQSFARNPNPEALERRSYDWLFDNRTDIYGKLVNTYFDRFKEHVPTAQQRWEILLRHERQFPNAGDRVTKVDREKDFDNEVHKIKKMVTRLADVKGYDLCVLISGDRFDVDHFPEMSRVIMSSNASGYAPERMFLGTNEWAASFGSFVQSGSMRRFTADRLAAAGLEVPHPPLDCEGDARKADPAAVHAREGKTSHSGGAVTAPSGVRAPTSVRWADEVEHRSDDDKEGGSPRKKRKQGARRVRKNFEAPAPCDAPDSGPIPNLPPANPDVLLCPTPVVDEKTRKTTWYMTFIKKRPGMGDIPPPRYNEKNVDFESVRRECAERIQKLFAHFEHGVTVNNRKEADVAWKVLSHILDEYNATLVWTPPDMFLPCEVVGYKSFASAPWLMKGVFAGKVLNWDDLKLIPAVVFDDEEIASQPPSMRVERAHMITGPIPDWPGVSKDYRGTHRFMGATATVNNVIKLYAFGLNRNTLAPLMHHGPKPASDTLYFWNQKPGAGMVMELDHSDSEEPEPGSSKAKAKSKTKAKARTPGSDEEEIVDAQEEPEPGSSKAKSKAKARTPGSDEEEIVDAPEEPEPGSSKSKSKAKAKAKARPSASAKGKGRAPAKAVKRKRKSDEAESGPKPKQRKVQKRKRSEADDEDLESEEEVSRDSSSRHISRAIIEDSDGELDELDDSVVLIQAPPLGKPGTINPASRPGAIVYTSNAPPPRAPASSLTPSPSVVPGPIAPAIMPAAETANKDSAPLLNTVVDAGAAVIALAPTAPVPPASGSVPGTADSGGAAADVVPVPPIDGASKSSKRKRAASPDEESSETDDDDAFVKKGPAKKKKKRSDFKYSPVEDMDVQVDVDAGPVAASPGRSRRANTIASTNASEERRLAREASKPPSPKKTASRGNKPASKARKAAEPATLDAASSSQADATGPRAAGKKTGSSKNASSAKGKDSATDIVAHGPSETSDAAAKKRKATDEVESAPAAKKNKAITAPVDPTPTPLAPVPDVDTTAPPASAPMPPPPAPGATEFVADRAVPATTPLDEAVVQHAAPPEPAGPAAAPPQVVTPLQAAPPAATTQPAPADRVLGVKDKYAALKKKRRLPLSNDVVLEGDATVNRLILRCAAVADPASYSFDQHNVVMELVDKWPVTRRLPAPLAKFESYWAEHGIPGPPSHNTQPEAPTVDPSDRDADLKQRVISRSRFRHLPPPPDFVPDDYENTLEELNEFLSGVGQYDPASPEFDADAHAAVLELVDAWPMILQLPAELAKFTRHWLAHGIPAPTA